MKTREGNYYTETHRQCTNCKEMFLRKGKDTMRICPKCNVARVKCLSAEYKMYNRAQQRSKKYNIEFNISRKDIKIPTHCPILGIPLIKSSGKSGGKKNSPSLDRINPNKGYTRDNIQVISQLANAMKSNASNEEMIKFAQWVFQTYLRDTNDIS